MKNTKSQDKKRYCVSITCDVYNRIKAHGVFGESFSQVLNRLLQAAATAESRNQMEYNKNVR